MPPSLRVVSSADGGPREGDLRSDLESARLQSDLGRQKTARALLRRAAARGGPEQASTRLLALIELRDGKPAAALAALDRAGAGDRDVDTLRVRAAALCQLGRAEEALLPAHQALAERRDVDTLAALGLAELAAGRESAAATAAAAVREFPQAATARRLACLVALRDRRWDAAEREARAASHCPGGEGTETHHNLALALIGQGRLAEARGMIRTAWVSSEVTQHAPVVLANRRQLEASLDGGFGGLRRAVGRGQSRFLFVLLGILLFGLAVRQLALPVLALALLALMVAQLRRAKSRRKPYRALPVWAGVTVTASAPG